MFEKKILMSLLCLVVMLSLLAPATRGANILFVSSMTTEADDALKAFMEGLGHTVTYIDDDEDEAATEAAAAAADLVYISESVGSGGIKNEITEVEVPMIIGEPWAWDEMGLTEGDGGDDPAVTTDVDIVGAGHYLAGGLSGSVGVLTEVLEGCNLGKGVTGPEATVIATATLSDGVTYDVIFVYEKGAALPVAPADGSAQVAADMRIGFGFHENCYPVLNENAYALLGAAVEYALGMTGPSEPVNPGTDGLLAYYMFDDGEGTIAVDSSGNGNDGILIGEQFEWVDGMSGGALLFPGLSDTRVEIPTTGLSTTAGTVAMWGLLVDPQPAQTKYFFGHTTQPEWSNRIQLYMDEGNNLLDLGLGDSHNRQNDIVELPMEEWLHVALTWDSGNYVVCLNGVNVATGTYTGLSDVNEIANIGNDGSRAPYEGFGGPIDEVRIYDRALSEGELLYLAGERAIPVDPGTDSLVAFYALDGDPNDSSGNGNNGTIGGTENWLDGKIGSALEFDGSSTYVEIPFSESLNLLNQGDFVLSAWFKADEIPPENKEVLQQGDGNGTGRTWLFVHNTNEIQSYLGGGTTASGVGVEAGVWTHAAVVVTEGGDADNIQLYVNGESAGEPTQRSMEDCEGVYFIGRHKNPTNFWDGLIDEVQLYNKALSTGEIRYLAGFRAMENPDIAAINELFNQATLAGSTGDVELYLSLFTEDAVVMAPGYTAFVGKEVLRPTFEGLFGLFDLELPYTVDEIVIPGDWAFVRSRFQYSMTPKEGGETTTNPGEELDILKRQADGSWKIYLECWNYDVPLPAPEVAATSEELGVVKLAQVDDADAMYREMCDLYALAAETGDVDLYVANYTADGVQMPPEAPNRIGSEEIRAAIEPALTLFDIECPIYPKEAVITGDWAFGWCEWSLSLTPKEGGQTTTFDGKGLDVIKRQADGSWKYYIECWNYNGPPTVE